MFTLGTVSYLNSAPLVAELPPEIRALSGVPADLCAWLASGRVDAALLPVAEALRGAGSGWLGRHGLACDGEVRSVLLFLPEGARGAGAVRRVVLDPASRTSVALTKILLGRRRGLSPAYETAAAPGPDPRAHPGAAVLSIGDSALRHRRGWTGGVIDLGEDWKEWTGLPFVFARWTARAGLPPEERAALAAILDESARRGLARREALAAERGPRHGLTPDEALAYMTDSMRYEIDARADDGLARFATELASIDAAAAGGEGARGGAPGDRAAGPVPKTA